MELEIIKNSILEIRGKKVMLDMDLAKLYEVETRVLKQAVRRNIERFPMDFMFELNENEIQNLTSHFVTTSWGGQRHKPFAFTEQGIAMLSSVLKSKKAIHMNISIMRAFVMMRQWAITLIADFDTHATAYYSACLISTWTQCPEKLYRRPSATKLHGRKLVLKNNRELLNQFKNYWSLQIHEPLTAKGQRYYLLITLYTINQYNQVISHHFLCII